MSGVQLEPATYESAVNQSYAHEHATIFQPIDKLYTLIRRTSSAVIHNLGAVG